MCCVTPFPSFGEAPCRFFSGPLGGPGGHLHLLPQQEEADGPALEEEGVDGGPAFGVGSLHGPGQGLGRHLGLVQGKEDQAVGGGKLPEEVRLQEVLHQDPVQLRQPFCWVHHPSLPWALAAR